MKKSKWMNITKDDDIMGGIMVGSSIDQSNYILMGLGGLFIVTSLYFEHFKDTVNE